MDYFIMQMGNNDEGIVNILNKLNGVDNVVNLGENDVVVEELEEEPRKKKKSCKYILCKKII